MPDSGASSAGIYAALLENSDDCISVLAADGRTVFQSAGVVRQLGYAPDELIGHSKFPLVHPEDLPAVEARFRAVLAGQPAGEPLVVRCRHKNGLWRRLEVATSLYTNGQGEAFVVLNSRDVTAVAEANAALRASEQRLGLALEIGAMGVSEFDFRTGQMIFSQSFVRLLGYEAVPRGADADWFMQHVHAEDRPAAEAAVDEGLRSRSDFEVLFRVVRTDGGIRWWFGRARVLRDDSGQPTHAIGLVSDITERRHLEEQVRQAQKLEAIGQLAGGIAHDFNNLLTVIAGYAETLLATVDPADERHNDVLEIRRAADRAALLTQQLLAFSRKQVLRPEIIDANAVVREIITMIGRLLGGGVELTADLAARPATVLVDRSQLEQVLINLAVNARDAMPEGGRLTIGTRLVDVNDEDAVRLYPIKTGVYVCLWVRDTGVGMPPHIQARVFEPFFTTKEPGKGTGIGLSTVYGIVKQSGGFIFFTSEAGQGTTFDVYLPHSRIALEEAAEGSERAETPGSPSQAATVLLVDDYRRVRDLARKVLTRQGYRVLTAESGPEAIDIAEQYTGPIDLLLSDVVMPNMSGPELARRLVANRPGMAVMYMSGYPGDVLNSQGVDPDLSTFLEKPFTPGMLSRKVRDVLAARKRRG